MGTVYCPHTGKPLPLKRSNFLTMILTLLGIIGAVSGIFFFTHHNDKVQPSGELTGIGNNYKQGDSVSYVIRGNDNKALKRIIFEVRNSPVREIWNSNSQAVTKESFFSTENWSPGRYDYFLSIEDKADNSFEKKGSFILAEKIPEDTEKPSGKVIGLKNNYIQGETIAYTVKADDNRKLRRISFEVKNSSVNETWNASGTEESKQSSFSTENWSPGRYDYFLSIEDEADNSFEKKGTFILAEKLPEDTEKPSGKVIGLKNDYIQNDTIAYTVKANDNRELRQISFEVKNSSVNEKWDVSGLSETKTSSFSTHGWNTGTYHYVFIIEDKSGNRKESQGSFVLSAKEPPDKAPTGEIIGIKNRYIQGDTVKFTVRAKDDRGLKKIIIEVTNSKNIRQRDDEYPAAGKIAEYVYSFSTNGWKTGDYKYRIWIEDNSDKPFEITSTFTLESGNAKISPKAGKSIPKKPEQSESVPILPKIISIPKKYERTEQSDSELYKKITELQDEAQKYRRMAKNGRLSKPTIIKFIRILEDTVSAYRKLPQTPEVKQGISVTSNAIEEWRKKTF